ncbi:MAG: hypothetical protein JWM86_2405, partial [Thermoleophilia bacterium]|nr:hypothetical protein [Thermoleophilia bacterium]
MPCCNVARAGLDIQGGTEEDGTMTDAIPGTITSDRRVFPARGTTLDGEARLPELSGVQPAPTPPIDQLGRSLR